MRDMRDMWEKFCDYQKDCRRIVKAMYPKYKDTLLPLIAAAKNDAELSRIMTNARKKYL